MGVEKDRVQLHRRSCWHSQRRSLRPSGVASSNAIRGRAGTVSDPHLRIRGQPLLHRRMDRRIGRPVTVARTRHILRPHDVQSGITVFTRAVFPATALCCCGMVDDTAVNRTGLRLSNSDTIKIERLIPWLRPTD